MKTDIRDRLREYESLFRQMKKEKLETMKKRLVVKKQNLIMLKETANNIDESEGYTYYLRKETSEKC